MDKEQLDALERIADLKDRGVITEAEFGKMKQKILSGSIPASDHQPSISGLSGPGSTSELASGPSQANDEEKRQADTLANAAILLGVIAFLFLPIVLGPIGIILGAISNRRGSDRGLIAVVVATIGTVAGMLIGILVWA
jgi:hypothetical protein